MNGQTLKKAFVPLPGGGAAVYTSAGLTYYRHSDWLGSGRLATTPTRTLYSDVAYGPYGESYAPSGTPDLDFTGQNQDTVSGLYDFLFREYNANQGRWPRPDPAGMGAVNANNPQTWNRYAYVANFPLTATDPLGLLSHWSDVVGTARGNITDPNLDPGGAWLAGEIQQFMVDAGLNSPVQQGLGTYLSSVYGGNNVRFSNGGWQGYIPYPSWTSDGGWTFHTGNGQWVSIAGAANNGLNIGAAPRLPWYKNSCITSALGAGAVSVGIDSIGLIPEAGGIARVIGHQAGYVGVVADQLGSRVVGAVGASTSTVNGLAGLGDTSPEGLLSTGLTVAGFIPGLGQLAAGASIVNDAIKTGIAISKCP